MSSHEHQLVQKITYSHDGLEDELDLSFLISATFIETTNLDSPKLIIEFDDKERILTDDLKISEDDVFTVVLADPYNENALDYEDKWVIKTMPVTEDNQVTFNLFLKSLDDLKKPSPRARLFVQKTIPDILRQLAPNLPQDVGVFPFKMDFHLLPSQRTSRFLRQVAKEMGALVFIRRGVLVFRSLEDLLNEQSSYQYHYNDTRQVYQIVSCTKANAGSMIADLSHRRYVGWDEKTGFVDSSKNSDSPIEFTASTNKFVLNNMSKVPVTVLDCYMHGNGGLRAGDCIEITWNRSDIEKPIDESLPTKVVLGTVSHSYKGKKYLNRIKAILNEY